MIRTLFPVKLTASKMQDVAKKSGLPTLPFHRLESHVWLPQQKYPTKNLGSIVIIQINL